MSPLEARAMIQMFNFDDERSESAWKLSK
jgi:hypothetical protein